MVKFGSYHGGFLNFFYSSSILEFDQKEGQMTQHLPPILVDF